MLGLMSDLMFIFMSPRRVASSSGIGEALCSPSTGLRSEVSNILLPLRTNRGPYAVVVPSLHHKGLLWGTLTP